MFGRKSAQPETPPPAETSTTGKGRPTPTRREAEAARKASLKAPVDPKAARRADRERQRAERAQSRQALVSGDERALPPRDAGPVRAFTRDFIDRRRSVGEIFIPVALLVLVMGFIRNEVVIVVTYYTWLVMLIAIVGDSAWIVYRLDKALKEKWPDRSDRKGAPFYAVMRALTIRRLRLPPPKFKVGGAPVVPKQPKTRR